MHFIATVDVLYLGWEDPPHQSMGCTTAQGSAQQPGSILCITPIGFSLAEASSKSNPHNVIIHRMNQTDGIESIDSFTAASCPHGLGGPLKDDDPCPITSVL